MEIRTVVLLVVAMSATVVSAQTNSSSGSSFGSLPKGNYTSGDADTVDVGSLQGVFDMAKGFVNVVFQPFAELSNFVQEIADLIINGGNENYKDILDYLGKEWQEIAKFEAGYIACLVFGLLFIVFVPLVGSIMCCCRCCCNNCGGRLEQSHKRSKSCWRQCLCVSMLILTALMAVPTVFVFLNNEWITQVVDEGPQKITAVLSDTSEYVNIVPKQIDYVTAQYKTVDDNVRPIVENMDVSVGVPYQSFVESQAEDSLRELAQAAQVQNEAIKAIDTSTASVTELEAGMGALNTSLNTLRENMTDPANLGSSACDGDPYCKAVFVSTSQLTVGFDVNSLSSIKADLDNLRTELIGTNITTLQADIEKEIEDIPNTVKTQTQDASKSAVEALNSASDAVDQVSSSLPTDGLDEFDNTISNLSNSITSFITGYDENFDKYRYIAGLVLGSMLAFIVACYFLGMLLGVCGHDRKVSPANRGCSSNCGGIMLMVGVGFSFIFSWLLMILVVVLFTIGGHGERYGCQGLEEPDYEALDLIANVTKLNLAETFNLPPEAQLTITGLLNSCKNDESAYSALKLEYVYNVSAYLQNVTQQLTTLETDLETAVSEIDTSAIQIYSKQSQSDLLALTNTAINTINFTQYLANLGNGVTQTDLSEYAMFLRASANNFTTAASYKQLVLDYADDVDRIQAGEVEDLQDDYDNLNASIYELIAISSQLNDTVKELDSALVAFNTSIATGSQAEIEKIADDLYDQVSGNITDYVNWAGDQVEKEVGACRPVYDAYTATVGVFCDYLIDTINGLWFSLGWCLFFLIPSAIIAMKLMKFFRRMNIDDIYDEDCDPERLPQLIYLPGIASHRADNIRTWDDMEMRDYGGSANKPNRAYY